MVFRKTLKKFCLRKFLVRVILDTRAPASELVLQGRPAFRDRITGGGGGGGGGERRVQNYVLRPGVRCTSKL